MMEARLSKLEETVVSTITYLKSVNENIYGVLQQMQESVRTLENDMEAIQSRLNALDGSSSKGFRNVEIKLDDLKAEIQKINQVTGYKDLHDNLKLFKGNTGGEA